MNFHQSFKSAAFSFKTSENNRKPLSDQLKRQIKVQQIWSLEGAMYITLYGKIFEGIT